MKILSNIFIQLEVHTAISRYQSSRYLEKCGKMYSHLYKEVHVSNPKSLKYHWFSFCNIMNRKRAYLSWSKSWKFPVLKLCIWCIIGKLFKMFLYLFQVEHSLGKVYIFSFSVRFWKFKWYILYLSNSQHTTNEILKRAQNQGKIIF